MLDEIGVTRVLEWFLQDPVSAGTFLCCAGACWVCYVYVLIVGIMLVVERKDKP